MAMSLGTGLQVFYNLGMLRQVMDNLLDTSHDKMKGMFTDLLDIKKITSTAEESSSSSGGGKGTGGTNGRGAGPGRAAMPGPGNMAAFRATLWTNVDHLLEVG